MAIGHFLANYSCMETLWPVFASYSLKAQSVHRRVGCGWFLGFFWAERGVKKCEVFRDITQGWWFPIFFLIKPYLCGQFIQFERYLHRLFNHHLWLSIKKTQKRRPKSYIYHLSTTRGSSNSPRLFKYPSTKNPTTNPTKNGQWIQLSLPLLCWDGTLLLHTVGFGDLPGVAQVIRLAEQVMSVHSTRHALTMNKKIALVPWCWVYPVFFCGGWR